ncbi:hypothetical protein FQR65_LT20333 [Abscondita terminalis]|nr:hypothetical protein FQR65_LT20333 [Abscondita terminalis]
MKPTVVTPQPALTAPSTDQVKVVPTKPVGRGAKAPWGWMRNGSPDRRVPILNLDGLVWSENSPWERRRKGVQAPGDLVFQSLNVGLGQGQRVFSKPEFCELKTPFIPREGWYVEVVIEENWRVRHNSHRP